MSSTEDTQEESDEELSDAELIEAYHKHMTAASNAFIRGDHEKARDALNGAKSYNARMADRSGWE